jgi:hypothetical protein
MSESEEWMPAFGFGEVVAWIALNRPATPQPRQFRPRD